MGVLAEELMLILKEAESGEVDEPSHEEESDSDSEEEPLCEGTDIPCWHLQEAVQFLAEDMAGDTGVSVGLLSVALTEAMRCDSECGAKYRTEQGSFKGGKGDAFKSCEKYAEDCCSGVTDPSAFCAYLGRRAGKIR